MQRKELNLNHKNLLKLSPKMAEMTLDTYEPAWNFISDRRTQFKFQCEYEALSRIQDIKEIREIF